MPSFRDIFLLGYIDILLFTHYVLNESNERNATWYSNILLPFQGECSDPNNEYDEEFDELPGGLVNCLSGEFYANSMQIH